MIGHEARRTRLARLRRQAADRSRTRRDVAARVAADVRDPVLLLAAAMDRGELTAAQANDVYAQLPEHRQAAGWRGVRLAAELKRHGGGSRDRPR